MEPPDKARSPVDPTTVADDVVQTLSRLSGDSMFNAPTAGGTTEDSGPKSATSTESVVSGKVFRFNPPLHNSNLPVRTDFSGVAPYSSVRKQYFDEQSAPMDTKDPSTFKNLRLGRIIQDELAAGAASTNQYRYGFRFLYNPTSVTISSSRNDSVVLDRQSMVSAAISGIETNFQVISFTLLLDRGPDLLSGTTASDYSPAISGEDLANIRKYGTHWDLEILYRVCNGVFNLKDRGKTSDIGIIIPSNARLVLGPGQNHFGFLESVGYTDIIFTKDMVPTRTEVQIIFRRHVDMSPNDMDSFNLALGKGVSSTVAYTANSRIKDTAKVQSLKAMITGGIAAGLGNILNWVGDAAEEVGEFFGVDTGSAVQGNPNDAPVPRYKVSTPFGTKGKQWSSGYHTGDDYSAPMGTPVLATRAGQVVFAGVTGGYGAPYGTHVAIQTGDVRHLYCHMSSLKVSKGQTVTQGQQVGTVGSTGTNSSGPHLHYEERVPPYTSHSQHTRKPIWGK